MKKLLAIFTVCFLYLHGNAQINDENAEVRIAKNFHGISLSSAFDVYLSQSNEEAVAVSASETRFRDRIKVEVRDGILRISCDREGLFNGERMKLKAYISFKQIDKLSVSGACDVYINGTLRADALTIKQSGASDLKGKLDVKKLSVDLSGASDMTVSGQTGQLDVEVSGASDFKGFDLVSDFCELRATGASDIKITVNKELSAHATGASDIRYRGEGLIRDIHTSGAGSVSHSPS